MTDKEKIRAYIEKLHKEHRGSEGDSIFRRALRTVLFYIDSLPEEPVSEDLGEYINELSKQFPEVSFAKLSRIAVRVAKWQKEQMMANAIDAVISDDTTICNAVEVMKLREMFKGQKVKVIVIKED